MPEDNQENKSQQASVEDVPQWQLELDRVGFARRLFLSRKWYGGDWWFVLISAILLGFIIIVGLFPQWFAPYDPRAEVGPSLLAPGEPPSAYVLVVRTDSGVTALSDIGSAKNNIGFIIGSPASQALRKTIDDLNTKAQEEGTGIRYQPRPRRFETFEEGFTALQSADLDGFVAEPGEIEEILSDFPELEVLGALRVEGTMTYTFGTNQIGQDVFSRTIWGTRIALIVGLSSALVAVLIGVPLGLISGFVSGKFDRTMTLFMDSVYSFPGLILAISIAAVLGAGMGNVVVAIAVIYVPTYFRIVRGQVLSIKQELYVEAARSLGAQWHSILRHYIFPNVIPSVVIIFSVNVADAILTEAGLSFLGLGLPPDTPDWGIDLARGQDYVRRAWWMVTFPGLMVSLVTLSFSMLGESLAEILNPRLADK